MNKKHIILLIAISLILSGCSTNGKKNAGNPIAQETYSLERNDDVWQITKDSDYYRFFNTIHQTYDALIKDAADPDEQRRLFIERDLMIAKERLNYKADRTLVRQLIQPAGSRQGMNSTGHIFRLQDVRHVPAQNFSPRHPEKYVFEELNPLFGSRRCDAMTAIIQFDRQLKKRGVQLIVVPVPNSTQVYAHQLDNGLSLENVIWHPWADMIVKLLEYDVEVLDLLDLFKAYSGDNTVLNYIDHHWGKAGLDIVGREIAHRFTRYHFDDSYYLDPSHFKVEPISVDMPALIPYWDRLDADFIMKSMNLPDEYGTVRITYDGKDIRPVPNIEDSPVLIMGDSFVPHLADSSSGIYAHLAYYTHIIPSAISKDAGAAKPPMWYAHSVAEREQEPKVVIWEIYGSAFNEVNDLNDWMVVKIPEPDDSIVVARSDNKRSSPVIDERKVAWITGEVVEVSTLPAAADAATYPDALYAYKVRVTDKQSSDLRNGDTIVVYTQYLKDYKPINGSLVSIGETRGFFVEDWRIAEKATYKIGTMQLIDDLDDFDSDVYYCYVLE